MPSLCWTSCTPPLSAPVTRMGGGVIFNSGFGCRFLWGKVRKGKGVEARGLIGCLKIVGLFTIFYLSRHWDNHVCATQLHINISPSLSLSVVPLISKLFPIVSTVQHARDSHYHLNHWGFVKCPVDQSWPSFASKPTMIPEARHDFTISCWLFLFLWIDHFHLNS